MFHYMAEYRAKQIPKAKERGFYIFRIPQEMNTDIGWRLRGEALPEDAQIISEHIWNGSHWHGALHTTEVQRRQKVIEHAAQFLDVEALLAIDWQKLTDWHLEDLPYCICALASPEKHIRGDGQMHVNSYIFDDHDNRIFPATPLVLPFILQLIHSPHTSERAAIIADIILPVAEAENYQPTLVRPITYIPIHPRQDRELPAPELLAEAQAAYLAIQEQVPFFLTLLTDTDASMRNMAGKVVAKIPSSIEIVAPALEQAFQQEQDELIQATFVYDLFHITREQPTKYNSWFEAISSSYPNELIRLITTRLFTYDLQCEITRAKVTALVSWLDTAPQELRQRYQLIPDYWYQGRNVSYDIMVDLCRCVSAFPDIVVPILLRFLRQSDYNYTSLWHPFKALIDYFFPSGQKVPAILSEEQREIIFALCTLEKNVSTYPWNNLLFEHGLPASQEALQKLLSHQQEQSDGN